MASTPTSNPSNATPTRHLAMAAVQKVDSWLTRLMPTLVSVSTAILLVAIPWAINLDRRITIAEQTTAKQSELQELKMQVALLQQKIESNP